MADETFCNVLSAPLGSATILHHQPRIESQSLTSRIGAFADFVLLTSAPALLHMLSVDGDVALPGIV